MCQSQKAINNVLDCFQGRHDKCRQNSLVCTAHLASYNTKHLPYGKHIAIEEADIFKIQSILDKIFSIENNQKFSRLSTTNKCESLHNQVFTFAPKNTVWSRNFTGLCHSAAHASSVGKGRSALIIARAIGISVGKNDPLFRQMMLFDKNHQYNALRKSSFFVQT